MFHRWQFRRCVCIYSRFHQHTDFHIFVCSLECFSILGFAYFHNFHFHYAFICFDAALHAGWHREKKITERPVKTKVTPFKLDARIPVPGELRIERERKEKKEQWRRRRHRRWQRKGLQYYLFASCNSIRWQVASAFAFVRCFVPRN